MPLSRRGFLTRLLSLPLLRPLAHRWPWTVPVGPAVVSPQLAEINALTLRTLQPAISAEYFKNSPMLAYLQRRDGIIGFVEHPAKAGELVQVNLSWPLHEDEREREGLDR